MADDFDEIEFALTGAADDADEATRKVARSGKLWLRAPAKNSPEIELMAAKYEEVASAEVEFVDDDEKGRRSAESESTYATNNDVKLFDFHIGLSRSLGEGISRSDYEAACQREGVKPMPKYRSTS